MKKTFQDEIYYALLQNYRKPAVSAEKNSQILAAIDAASGRKTKYSSGRKFFSPGRLVPAISFAAILVILAVVWLGGYLRLPGQVIITYSGDPASSRQLVKPGVIASKGAEITLLTPWEEVTLLPETQLELKNSSHAFSRQQRIHYRLQEGTVIISHAQPGRQDTFRLFTPFGTVEVQGTLFMAGYTNHELQLACRQGRISFTSTLTGKSINLAAGQYYSLAQKADEYPEEYQATGVFATFLQSVQSSSGESIQTEPTFQPRIDSTPQTRAEQSAPAAGTPQPSTPVRNQVAMPTNQASPLPTPGIMEIWKSYVDKDDYSHLLAGSVYLVLGCSSRLRWYDRDSGAQAGSWEAAAEILSLDLYQDTAYCYTAGGLVQALDLQTGRVRWQQLSGPLAFGAVTVTDKWVFVPSTDSTLYIYNRRDGTPGGRIDAGSGLYGKPLADNNRVIFTTLSRQILCYRLADTALSWTAAGDDKFIGDRPGWHQPSGTVILKDKSGRFYLIMAANGEILFKSGLLEITTAAAVAADRLYLAGADKLTACGFAGTVLLSIPWPETIEELFVIEEAALLVNSAEGLNLLDLQLRVLQTFPVHSRLSCQTGSDIFLFTDTSELYKLEVQL